MGPANLNKNAMMHFDIGAFSQAILPAWIAPVGTSHSGAAGKVGFNGVESRRNER